MNKPLTFAVVPIDEPDPAPYNPRKISAQALEKLKASIRDLGFAEPVVVNKRNNVIVSGHQRVRAAKELGLTEIPVAYGDWEPAEERAVNIALNNLELRGEWDLPKLVATINEIEQMNAAVVGMTGFAEHEIERMKRKLEHDLNKITPVYPLASKLMEHYDYIVIFTENETDFVHLRQILGVQTVRSYKKKKKGIGRVVRFADFIKLWEGRDGDGGTGRTDADGVGQGPRGGIVDVEDGRDDVREDPPADEDSP